MTDPIPGTLPAGASAHPKPPEVSTVHYTHGSVTVYSPTGNGTSRVQYAQCTHKHPDTPEGWQVARECGERLARIIEQGRLPKWATIT